MRRVFLVVDLLKLSVATTDGLMRPKVTRRSTEALTIVEGKLMRGATAQDAGEPIHPGVDHVTPTNWQSRHKILPRDAAAGVISQIGG
jgi:hypothetical protein